MNKKVKLTTFEIVLFGVLGALTFAAKFAMSWLYNIEPVSLMILLFAVTFGWKALYPTYLYVAMEVLFYGISVWNIYYLYVWAVLAILAILFRKMEDPLGWAILSGAFGLAFGALCGITDIFIYGIGTAVAKWVMGIGADLLHCGGNFVITLVLFAPMRKLLGKLNAKIHT